MADKKEKEKPKEVKVSKEDLSVNKNKDQNNNIHQSKAASEEKKESLQEITRLLQLTQANFENYRKQTEKRTNEIKTMAAQDVLVQVLPLLDYLGLALRNVNSKFDCNSGCDTDHNCDCGRDVSCEGGVDCNATKECNATKDRNTANYAEFVHGIELIYSQLEELLKKNALEQIKTVGELFDPYYHEALMKVESDFPTGTIVEEFQKGFTLHGKVIRHAKVKVSSGKKTPPANNQNKQSKK